MTAERDAPTGSVPVASPCTGVCRIDPGSGCCAGCLRTLDEIAAWSKLDEAGRRAVCDRLPPRRAEVPRVGVAADGGQGHP